MSLPITHVALLIAAGFLAGLVNAAAGGGSLISFPVLLATGVPPLTANMTNTVALCPGYLGGFTGYRGELGDERKRMGVLALTATTGALAGVALLLVSPAHVFQQIVPFLVLFACGLLAFQPRISGWVHQHRSQTGRSNAIGIAGGQFAASVYGAYFGAGLGIVVLGLLGVMSADSMQRLNAEKTLLALVVNVSAAILFVLIGRIEWLAVAFLAPASLLGGRLGAHLARRLGQDALRWSTVAFGGVVALALLSTAPW
jgi:uncharacterized membrane protein YfcA